MSARNFYLCVGLSCWFALVGGLAATHVHMYMYKLKARVHLIGHERGRVGGGGELLSHTVSVHLFELTSRSKCAHAAIG